MGATRAASSLELELELELEAVREFIRKRVGPDWEDEEEVTRSRYKAFSGQRSDWDSLYHFWRLLILDIARHFRLLTVSPSQVKNIWFNRGGLTPLCLDHVFFVMYKEGDLIRRSDLVDPTATAGSRLSRLFRKATGFLLASTTVTPDSLLQEDLIVTSLLKDKSEDVVKLLSQSHWTSSCVVTMTKFHDVCGGPQHAYAVLSYLSSHAKASYLSTNKTESIEGIKLSLSSAPVPSITSLDCNVLHLLWTLEKLQQQLHIFDQKYERSRELALASMKSGNRKIALRHARELKLVSESRERCTSLFNRVEEVLNLIVNAEATKKVSEAIQIGAQAIKENKISVEEVQVCLQELDETIDMQKQVESALESTPSYTDIDDEDAEEEFRKLELEVGSGDHQIPTHSTGISTTAGETDGSGSVESLCDALSNIKVADQPAEEPMSQDGEIPLRLDKLEDRKLEPA